MSDHPSASHQPHPSKTIGGSACWFYSDAYTWKPGFFMEFIAGDEPRVPVVDARTGTIVIVSFRNVSFASAEPKDAPVRPRAAGGA